MLQFDIWNDFESSLPKLLGCSVNELDPMVNVVNDPNPFRLNVDTLLNLLDPIFNDTNAFKFVKLSWIEFSNERSPIDIDDNFGKSILSFNFI